MVISQRQIEERRKHIGASDVGALFGVDPFKNMADVWMSKVYPMEAVDGGRWAAMGNALEPAVLQMFCDETGAECTANVTFMSDCGYFAANLDAEVTAPPAKPMYHGRVIEIGDVVEVKTSSREDEWGPNLSDVVPDRVILQVQTQMYCSGARRAWIPTLLHNPRPNFRIYYIERDDDLIENIKDVGAVFWDKYVIPKVKPDGPPPSESNLKAVKRLPAEKTVDLTEEDERRILAWEAAKKEVAAAKKEVDEMRRKLKFRLGQASVGVGKSGALVCYKDGAGREQFKWKPH